MEKKGKRTAFERMSENRKLAYIRKFYRHFKGLKPAVREEIRDYVQKNPKLHDVFADIL